jgi:hypothetical protein
MQPAFLCDKSSTLSSPWALYNNILNDDKDDDDSDDDPRERVRVPRRGQRRYEEDRYKEEYETKEQPYYDDEDEEDYYDDEEEDEDYYDDEEEDDDDKETENDDYDGDILIPNPILDQVDPEGAGERFGEIVRDPTFWRDLVIVVAVFNFCEYVAHVPYY